MSIATIHPDTGPAPFASYHPSADRDECRDGDGGQRPAWRPVATALDTLGTAGIEARQAEADRLLRQDGVTYDLLGEGGADRPWRLDAIPAVLDAAQWRRIARGVAQRARLLDALLADCYGERRLLASGALPPEALYAHPGFLRPCTTVAPPDGHHLHMVAVDLLRIPGGEWVVTDHRCQAPPGCGYALENRVVVARSFPAAYHQAGVLRLAAFFRDLLDQLRSLAPHHRDNPRIVLLTPPAPHPAAFESAYLARYLNLPLVRGEDLTVRDDGVHLKTLGGLEPVDVVLRRCDDHRSDPLELDTDGTSGTPGLLHAARRGRVAVVNAFGAGLAENAAWLPRLPELCRTLLDEDLALSSVATFWGPESVDHVAADLDHLVVKPAFGTGLRSPISGAGLDRAARASLLAQLREHPYDHVAQAALDPSTTPTWLDGRLVARPMVLRTWALRLGDEWRVMDGGLVRVATGDEPVAFALERGGLTKDLWILADGPVPPISLLPPGDAPLVLRRNTGALPSRVADNLLWHGRYAERAEATARLLRLLVQARDGEGGVGAVTAALGALGPHPTPADTDWLQRLLAPDRPDSLPWLFDQLRRSALIARDRLSNDTWRLVNRLAAERQATDPADPLPALETAITGLAALAGMLQENGVRSPGWHCLDLGRRIERAAFLCRALPAMLTADRSATGLISALELADSLITYRARYLTVLQEAAVVDLLVCDGHNPRGLRFQIEAIAADIAALGEVLEPDVAAPLRAFVGELEQRVATADVEDLCARNALGEMLTSCHGALMDLAHELTTRVLSHTDTSRQFGRFGPATDGE